MREVGESMHVTTSTVSQQIAALTREAGTPLIEPDGRRVRLTPAGQRLAGHAVTILAALEAARLDLDPAAFPVGMCTRTVLAKAEIVLWRRADDSFHLEVWRSFAAYVSGVLAEAARDLADD